MTPSRRPFEREPGRVAGSTESFTLGQVCCVYFEARFMSDLKNHHAELNRHDRLPYVDN
jgi:hypothetical protein